MMRRFETEIGSRQESMHGQFKRSSREGADSDEAPVHNGMIASRDLRQDAADSRRDDPAPGPALASGSSRPSSASSYSLTSAFAGFRGGAALSMTPRLRNDTTVPRARLPAIIRRRPVPVNT